MKEFPKAIYDEKFIGGFKIVESEEEEKALIDSIKKGEKKDGTSKDNTERTSKKVSK